VNSIRVEKHGNDVHFIFAKDNRDEALELFNELHERLKSGEEFKLVLQAGKVVTESVN
jgi:hypothetical protein